MKSAGIGRFVANDIEPESNQVSNTSDTRFILPPQLQENSTSSTTSLCKSFTKTPLAFSSWAADSNTCSFLQASHRQTGIVLAQKRWREIDQSRAPASHCPNLPSFTCSGDQLIFL